MKELEGAKERLILCKADLLDYESLKEAINGCDGVFHTASPVTDDPVSYFFQPFEFFYCLDATNLTASKEQGKGKITLFFYLSKYGEKTKGKNRLDRNGSNPNFVTPVKKHGWPALPLL